MKNKKQKASPKNKRRDQELIKNMFPGVEFNEFTDKQARATLQPLIQAFYALGCDLDED